MGPWTGNTLQRLIWLLGCAALVGAAFLLWRHLQPAKLESGFAAGNGRIEAVEIDIASKNGGRIRDILVDEGDFAIVGQELARMDSQQLEALLREAEAQRQQARFAIETSRSKVEQRLSEKEAALAVVAQREAEQAAARKRSGR